MSSFLTKKYLGNLTQNQLGYKGIKIKVITVHSKCSQLSEMKNKKGREDNCQLQKRNYLVKSQNVLYVAKLFSK
jgi:hypothetical protein